MVTEFISGRWYRWTGPKERPRDWNPEGDMDAVLDGEPCLCILGLGTRATFDKAPRRDDIAWQWGNTMQYWKEVESKITLDDLIGEALINMH